ncbi:MAG: sensor domain-containing diguanylate cyclase [Beijerinckiaceae bacterium]|nr:sensor domain-containing diguanylate cyclase [Beijerinckiaceae bacterium]
MTQLPLADRIIDGSAEAIMVTDRDNRIVRVNPAFTAITGYTVDEAIGQPPKLLSSGKHPLSFYHDMWFALRERGSWQGEIWNKRKSGEIYPEWVSINLLYDEQGAVTHHVAFFSDISLQKEGHAKIQRMAHYDSLTGLGNRLLMRDRLNQAIATARRSKHHVAVLFIDFDGFKQVNDRFGHKVGDRLLVMAASRMADVVRLDDMLFRQGGDEFVVILSEIKHPDSVALVANRLIREISKPYKLLDHQAEIGASIGIAMYPEDGLEIEPLLDAADTAMYKAKKTGRGRFCRGDASWKLAGAV